MAAGRRDEGTDALRAFLAPAVAVLALFFVAPLCIVIAYSLMSRGVYGGVVNVFTLENWVRLFDPLYGMILLRTVVMAVCVTVACLLLGFPFALFIARSGRRKHLYLQLVILPFWTSFLVRTYAWMFLLRDTGLINTLLQAIGIIREPLPLLYNDGAVFIGLVYGHLPFGFCRFTQRSSAWIRACSRPPRIWAHGPGMLCCAS